MARARRSADRGALNVRARVALFVGVAIFTVGALAQALAALWIALLALLFGGSAEVLVHTGGLETRTFAACSVAAMILDAVLLVAITATSVRRSWRRASSPEPERFAARHPIAAAALGLLCALAFVLAFGWRHSIYFPYPLATVVVLANAYFFALFGVATSARLAGLAWRRVKAWGLSSQYRTGFLTASLLLIGGAGYWLLTARWYAAPLDEVEARLKAEDPGEVTGILSGELDGLCLAAGVLEPALAHSGAAPACGFLSRGSAPQDGCFSSLMTDVVPDAKRTLRGGVNEDDLDDAIMKAILATCTRQPPPDNLAAYFYTVARNEIRRMMQGSRREVSCEYADDLPSACSPSELPEIREAKLAVLWKYALCKVGQRASEILRLRLEDSASFGQIGERLGITENQAKDTFHNPSRSSAASTWRAVSPSHD